MSKFKVINFSAGRGTSLNTIVEIESSKSLEQFVTDHTEQLNDRYSKEQGDDVRGTEDGCDMYVTKDGSYSVSHGTCDYDMIIPEGHVMWNVTDEDELVEWGDNSWDP